MNARRARGRPLLACVAAALALAACVGIGIMRADGSRPKEISGTELHYFTFAPEAAREVSR
ncbi:MAG: hypothetical protein ACT4QG_20710 [Sporichthyaceae bacterium]